MSGRVKEKVKCKNCRKEFCHINEATALYQKESLGPEFGARKCQCKCGCRSWHVFRYSKTAKRLVMVRRGY